MEALLLLLTLVSINFVLCHLYFNLIPTQGFFTQHRLLQVLCNDIVLHILLSYVLPPSYMIVGPSVGHPTLTTGFVQWNCSYTSITCSSSFIGPSVGHPTLTTGFVQWHCLYTSIMCSSSFDCRSLFSGVSMQCTRGSIRSAFGVDRRVCSWSGGCLLSQTEEEEEDQSWFVMQCVWCVHLQQLIIVHYRVISTERTASYCHQPHLWDWGGCIWSAAWPRH